MGRQVSLVLLILLILLAPSSLAGDEKAEEEAVKAFKQYVADFMGSYETGKHELAVKLDGGWVKWHFEPVGTPSIDVRKTDSLISPYAGVCEFTLAKYFTALHKSAEEAQADDKFVGSSESKHRHTYAFQEGHWVPISRQHYDSHFKSWFDCDECNVHTGAPFDDIDGCWEPDAKHHLKPCNE